MSSYYLDFSSCGIVPGFCKSGYICYIPIHVLSHQAPYLRNYCMYQLLFTCPMCMCILCFFVVLFEDLLVTNLVILMLMDSKKL